MPALPPLEVREEREHQAGAMVEAQGHELSLVAIGHRLLVFALSNRGAPT